MDLRPAIPDDLPDIAQLHEANWRRDYVRIVPALALGADLTTYMEAHWGDGALSVRRVFVAREGAALLGFASMLDEGPDGCAFVDALHVAAHARAQGVGRALMSAIALLAIPGALTLEVLSENTAARAIYRRWGGQESIEFNDQIMGHPVTSVTVGWRDCVALAERLSGDTG